MKIIRKLHFFIGVLFAPTIVFFALSGSFQMLGLHEGSDASSWIAKMGQIHKDQTIDSPPPRKAPAQPKPDTASAPRPPERAGPHRSYPLLVWFFALALGLLTSTGLGIYMAFAYKRDRVVILSLLAAGIVIPVVFAFL
jgi:hypothetical protein